MEPCPIDSILLQQYLEIECTWESAALPHQAEDLGRRFARANLLSPLGPLRARRLPDATPVPHHAARTHCSMAPHARIRPRRPLLSLCPSALGPSWFRSGGYIPVTAAARPIPPHQRTPIHLRGIPRSEFRAAVRVWGILCDGLLAAIRSRYILSGEGSVRISLRVLLRGVSATQGDSQPNEHNL
ncbi:hypothetical protein B0H17DRAFT_1150426 [Mycena rosella]|uniref:Uncharacterized protein n=1 Tax=Mycena rosella TaxID=1033263 RepID=A0AAD7BT25_MYCRO|nr:hypothetical protein B0H17DRAFT_1150426 [Mycena rosella]